MELVHQRVACLEQFWKRGFTPCCAPMQDPEGLFGKSAPASGIIERRLMQQRISTDKEFAASFESMQAKLKEELQEKRDVSVWLGAPAARQALVTRP